MTQTGDIDMTKGRTRDFEKSADLETVLSEINGAIGDTLSAPYNSPQKPVIMVVGCPRSGSTLMLQWLASLGCFAYPSNLLARFYTNPYFGARIQQALVDADNTGMIGLTPGFDFASNLGRTKGATAPSEFWYYWRQFYPMGDIATLSADELSQIDTATVRRGIAGIEAAFNKPVALKGMMHNFLIPHLGDVFDKLLLINVERDSVMNAQSLLGARKKFFGDQSRWYSFKPPEYTDLKDKDPITQVSGQVAHTKRRVREGLAHIDDNRKLTISYEDFCNDPAAVFAQIKGKLAAQDCDIHTDHAITPFTPSGKIKLTEAELSLLKQKLTEFGDDQ